MEQCAKAGCVSQTAGGAPAGHRGGQPAPKVRLIRCGAAHLQGAFSQQRALQVQQISAFFGFAWVHPRVSFFSSIHTNNKWFITHYSVVISR